MRDINPEKRLFKPFVYTQETLPIDKPIALYIRQSTDTQVKKNVQSTLLQDVEMNTRLEVVGFCSIIKIATDQGVSGQKRRDEREGLDHLCTLIEQGKIGAVAGYDASRFFRDLTHVYYAEFIQLLVKYSIPCILFDEENGLRVYWPNRATDMDTLREEFKTAAFYLRHIYGKVLPAKMKAIENGSYGGHNVPMGFIVTESKDRKYYVVYEPHAKLVRFIFKRYRELGGNLARLGRELYATGFSFPSFEGVEKIPNVALKYKQNGYPCYTRAALESILTNPAYVGWYVYDGVVVSKTNHEPIVAMDDFLYAYSRLSPINLDGTKNEHKPIVSRRYTTIPALCENILWHGGNTCYATKHGYRTHSSNMRQYDYTTMYIPIDLVDTSVSTAILGILSAMDRRHKKGLQDSLYTAIEALLTDKTATLQTTTGSVENLDKAIKGWELDKASSRETGNKQGLDEANRQLKRLYAAKDALVEKIKATKQEHAILAETQSLHRQAIEQWYDLDFERQQRFVALLVKRVELTEVTPHILKIALTFNQPIGCTITGYLWRFHGEHHAWTDEELSILAAMYPSGDRLAILQALSRRTWHNIKCYAYKKGIKRLIDTRKAPFHKHCTYQDWLVIESLQETYIGFGTNKIYGVWEPFDVTTLSTVSRNQRGEL